MVTNKDYLRKKIGVKEKYLDVYLTTEKLRGRIDEVLLLNDNTMAPLDYKFAKFNDIVYSTYKTQIVCYAILIEENFNNPVNMGYIVYVRSKNKLVKIDITEKDKNNIVQKIDDIIEIIAENKFPKKTKVNSRCISCTYRNICIQ